MYIHFIFLTGCAKATCHEAQVQDEAGEGRTFSSVCPTTSAAALVQSVFRHENNRNSDFGNPVQRDRGLWLCQSSWTLPKPKR